MRIDVCVEGQLEDHWQGSPQQLSEGCARARKFLAALQDITPDGLICSLLRHGFPLSTRYRARAILTVIAWAFAKAAEAPNVDTGIVLPFDNDVRLRIDLRLSRGRLGLTLQRTDYGWWLEPYSD